MPVCHTLYTQLTFANGKICYIEIPALDIQQSSKFYQDVFGWNVREDNSGNISFDDTVGQVSGMWVLDREPAIKPGLLISIMVYSVSDTLKLIVENNGKVVQAPTTTLLKLLQNFQTQQEMYFACTKTNNQSTVNNK